MDLEPETNPYQTPSAMVADAAAARDAPVLKDPRWLGALVLLSVSALCVFGLAQSFTPVEAGWSERLDIGTKVAFFLSLVSYLIWIYRCAANVQRLNRFAEFRPGWAVACHFIPVVNWVAPCLILMSISRDTFKPRPIRALHALVIVWWVALLVRSFCLKWASGVDDVWIFGVWFVATMISWIAIGVLVTRVSRRQAAFRWSDLPVTVRPMMMPLGSRPMSALGSARPLPPRRMPLQPKSYAELAEAEERSQRGDDG